MNKRPGLIQIYKYKKKVTVNSQTSTQIINCVEYCLFPAIIMIITELLRNFNPHISDVRCEYFASYHFEKKRFGSRLKKEEKDI